VIGVLLSALAALSWGIGGVAGGLGARIVGPQRLIAWSLGLGMALAIPLSILAWPPGRIDVRVALWVVLVTTCMLAGLVFTYLGMRRGSISVVAPISALYGGVAALISITLGEPVSALAVGSLALAVVGGVLASSSASHEPGAKYQDQRAAAGLAALCALVWGVQLWAGGQIEDDLGASWLVVFARGLALVVLVALLLPRRQLAIPRRVIPYALIAGCGEVTGFTLFLVASEYGLAQASVVTGQYGTVAALIGIVVLKERLRPIQYVGLVLVVLAVIGLSLF
jgi:drug/metabolite transporter (DMT)-like permease